MRGNVKTAERNVVVAREDVTLRPVVLQPVQDNAMQQQRPIGAWIAYLAICLIWGTTFLAIRVAVATTPPLIVTAGRFIGAGAILLVVAMIARVRFPARGEDFRRQMVTGVINVALANAPVVWAEQYISSGLAALLAAMIPIWMAVLEAASGGSRFTRRKVAGLLLGFSGVGLLVAPAIGRPDVSVMFFLAVAAMQVNCISWNVGTLRSKRRPSAGGPLAVAAVQMLSGGFATAVIALIVNGTKPIAWSPRSLAAVLYLMIFGSVIAYSAFLYALQHLSPGKLSSYAYVNPLIAVIVGAIALHETLTLRIFIAMTVILAGVAVIQLEKRRG